MVDTIGSSGEIVNPVDQPPPPESQAVDTEASSAPAPLPEYAGTQVDTSA